MNYKWKYVNIAFAAGMLSVPFVVFGEKPPFERYQSILDRQPFGAPPEGFNPNQLASDAARTSKGAGSAQELTKEQENLQKSVSFNAINIESDGTVMVGFTDKSDPKNPRCHYVRVGQSQDGWLVKSADPVAKTMVVLKDSIELTLALGSDSSSAAASAPGAQAKRSSLIASGPDRGQSSHRSRRAERIEREEARREEEDAQRKRIASELEQARQDLQRDREQEAARQAAALEEQKKESDKQRKMLEEQRKMLEELRNRHAEQNPLPAEGEEEEDE